MSDLIEEFKRQIATLELPDLGPGPRAQVQPQAALNRRIDSFLNQSKFSSANGDLIRSLVLLWHDHLEDAHVIAQDIGNADGSFVHGIMHRREPDYGNAKYWFRRVGKHSCFPELAEKVAGLLGSNQRMRLAGMLVHNGEWDSYAFVDACEHVAERPASNAQNCLLKEIQRIEFEVLLESFWGGA